MLWSGRVKRKCSFEHVGWLGMLRAPAGPCQRRRVQVESGRVAHPAPDAFSCRADVHSLCPRTLGEGNLSGMYSPLARVRPQLGLPAWPIGDSRIPMDPLILNTIAPSQFSDSKGNRRIMAYANADTMLRTPPTTNLPTTQRDCTRLGSSPARPFP